jgi:hypothetical protein
MQQSLLTHNVSLLQYVDVDYSGGGIDEYQFYDSSTGTWDNSTCVMDTTASSSSGSSSSSSSSQKRCVKMDCHMPVCSHGVLLCFHIMCIIISRLFHFHLSPMTWILRLYQQDTHFKLLGVYKEKDYAEWFEQLFKHEGYCIWSDEEYEFMQTYRNAWPEGCTASSYSSSDGNTIYFDLKPVSNGDMSIGLYNDNMCSTEYSERQYSVTDVLQAYDNYGGGNNNKNGENNYYFTYTSFANYLDEWNEAFSIYKLCQPCKAYNLNNQEEKRNGHRQRHRFLNDYQYNEDSDPNDGKYQCQDDAGYTNVNQCTKFRSKTEMSPVTFRELTLANQQNSMVRLNYNGVSLGHAMYPEHKGYKLMRFALIYFFFSLVCMIVSWRVYKIRRTRYEQSLLGEKEVKKRGRSNSRNL